MLFAIRRRGQPHHLSELCEGIWVEGVRQCLHNPLDDPFQLVCRCNGKMKSLKRLVKK